MTSNSANYELVRDVERYLAALSRLYTHEGEQEKQRIIVNAQIRAHEVWTSDNWNGGTYGHALFLTLPLDLYLSAARDREKLQTQICEDLNKIHNVPNEHFAEVFIEMETQLDKDWRRESGKTGDGKRTIAPEANSRIWGHSGYRIFLSHKSEVKTQTADLKTGLEALGASCFVAHEDIQPTREWQAEIENALESMDAFVALLTDGFHESLWTDQEVGFAVSRGVPIVAVKLGTDPYGFIGKFQALACGWKAAPKSIANLLASNSGMIDAYIDRVEKCFHFEEGNSLAELLPGINRLTDRQVERLIAAYSSNSELQGSWGFNGTRPGQYGSGLGKHLSRITGKKYRADQNGLIALQQ